MGSKVIRNITKVFRSASGVLFGRSTAGTGRGEEIPFASIPALIGVYTTAEVDSIIGGIDGLTATDIDTLAEINAILTDADLASVSYVDTELSAKQDILVSGTNIKTVNGSSLLGPGDLTVSGLSGTGSVDNAALRADGTGGATLQSSNILINDVLTASPNNTVNHVCIEAIGATTNVSVSVKPKGTGSFSLHAPDGTSAGGNVRGANTVDLQTSRYSAAHVANGTYSIIAGGANNTANGTLSAVVGGQENTASATYSVAFGGGALANKHAMIAFSAGIFSAFGDAQAVRFQARIRTTSAIATELRLDGSSARLTVTSGKTLSALVRVVGIKSDGSEVIKFLRDVTIKNVGGTTSLEASPVTIGTDINVSGATLNLSADDTNDTLKIEITPPSGTWRWHAIVECANEIAYGT